LVLREVARGDLDVWFPRWQQGVLQRGGPAAAEKPQGVAGYMARLAETHDRLMANYAEKKAAWEAERARFQPWRRRQR